MSCILHFGMHKTGSGSIQRSLHTGLADPRFHYVDLGRANASPALTIAFSATPELQNMNRKSGLSRSDVQPEVDRHRARLDRELRAAEGRTALLSAEHVIFLKPPELDALVRFLEERGGLLAAVGYIRAPASFMASVFQQRLKGGREDLAIEQAFPRYRQRFARLESAVGRARMRYWLFDPRAFPGNCVVRDFCARLDIAFSPAAVVRHNEGLSLPALRLLYAYRRFGPGYGSGKRAIQENFALGNALGTLPGPKLAFHAEVVAPLLETHRGEIAWMEERLGGPLGEPLREDAGAVRTLDELLTFGAEELAWLAERTGGAHLAADPRTVAERMHTLRLSLRPPRGWREKATRLFAGVRKFIGTA